LKIGINVYQLYMQEVGDWKNYFSDEQSRRLDERLEQWQKERAEPVPLIFEL